VHGGVDRSRVPSLGLFLVVVSFLAGCGLTLDFEHSAQGVDAGKNEDRDAGGRTSRDAGELPPGRDGGDAFDAAMGRQDAGLDGGRATCRTISCGSGSVCFEWPDGRAECVPARSPASIGCMIGAKGCECASHVDCRGAGGCVDVMFGYCGGAEPLPSAMCVDDECDVGTSSGCAMDEICVPGGAWGGAHAECASGVCTSNADCTASGRGRCTVFRDRCSVEPQLACRYLTDTCDSDVDCAGAFERCVPRPDGHGFECVFFEPPL
jgi:hypothetical protein